MIKVGEIKTKENVTLFSVNTEDNFVVVRVLNKIPLKVESEGNRLDIIFEEVTR